MLRYFYIGFELLIKIFFLFYILYDVVCCFDIKLNWRLIREEYSLISSVCYLMFIEMEK